MTALAAIQIKRRQLVQQTDISDEDWYDLVERTTGKRSTKNLAPRQNVALLTELDRLLGGRHKAPSKTPSKTSRKPLEGPYAKKIQALWISMWNLGLVKSRDDEALNAFVIKQTGLGHANWMRDPQHASAVIEALKGWMTRERGVGWELHEGDALFPDHMREPGYKIAAAQWAMVNGFSPYNGHTLASYVRFATEMTLAEMQSENWIMIMNSLGERIRKEAGQGVE